jgi:hypothetical protein
MGRFARTGEGSLNITRFSLGEGCRWRYNMECEFEVRKAKINNEIVRLTSLFDKIDDNARNVVLSLIDSAAFMTVMLRELEIEINKNGCISEYKNGENQYGTKKSPEVEVYNAMVKNLSSVIKQLTDLIPKDERGKSNDELMKYLRR